MALQYITESGYESYFGLGAGEAPDDIERKEAIALILFDSVTTDRFPTPTQVTELDSECQSNIERAFYEQINYFDIEPSSYEDASSIKGRVTVGKYTEENPGTVSSSNGRARLSPLAWNYLERCVTEYGTLTYLGVNCRYGGNRGFTRNFD